MTEDIGKWRIKRMPGNDSHGFMAVTPGCEGDPHPTRWCKCKPFRTHELAKKYIDQVAGEAVSADL
ncbi:hypothetical protein ACTXM3_09410 [Glutamicibacter arilaitensis]|uniref:hypothetical protein n=1 Tax=Glutamicibacter arilaitensis TaxID=256701 RepID=UPI003FD33268